MHVRFTATATNAVGLTTQQTLEVVYRTRPPTFPSAPTLALSAGELLANWPAPDCSLGAGAMSNEGPASIAHELERRCCDSVL